MNEEYILQRIKPYLNDEGMLGEEDFDKIFYMLNKREQYKVIEIMIANNIEIDYINRSISKKIKEKENNNSGKKCLDKLTNEQLCVLFQQGYKQALEALIIKNENLIWSRVNKYKNIFNQKLEDEDLLQYGKIGLINAAQRFDSKRETKFITYAICWIDQKILRSIIDYGFTVRLPVHIFESIFKIMQAFKRNSGFSNDQIFEKIKEDGLNREKFETLINILHNVLSITSLNTYIGEDQDSELGSFVIDNNIPLVEDQIELKALKQIVKNVLDTMKPREKRILMLRYGIGDDEPRTLEEIGKKYNLTRERIRQIEEKALKKLRNGSRSKLLKEFI